MSLPILRLDASEHCLACGELQAAGAVVVLLPGPDEHILCVRCVRAADAGCTAAQGRSASKVIET